MKVLLLVHTDLIPPENVVETDYDWDKVPWVTEFEVRECLKKLKKDLLVLGVTEDLMKIRNAIKEFQPDIVFNLLEEFKGEAVFDQHIVSYLELLDVPYTGCNPKGMTLGRDKALSKKILTYHKIKTPKFTVYPKNKSQKSFKMRQTPLIVKCLNEEASLGLSQASIVKTEEKLKERVEFIHKNFNTAAIAEEYIPGKEFFVGVYGNYSIKSLPPFELKFSEDTPVEHQFYSTSAKFNTKYRERHEIKTAPAEITEELSKRLQTISKKAYKALGLSGYGRMDLRYNPEKDAIYVIEANPNPDISEFDDFSNSAKNIGITYPKLIDKILHLGLDWASAE